jgi:hypothetical protein
MHENQERRIVHIQSSALLIKEERGKSPILSEMISTALQVASESNIGSTDINLIYRKLSELITEQLFCIEKSLEWNSFQQQIAEAQYKLGELYDYGIGVDANTSEAVAWYRRAAENGHLKAQDSLGTYLYVGRGCEQNYFEAIKWLRKSMAKAYGINLLWLADCYAEGKGTPVDLCEAYMLYKVIAEKSIDDGSISAEVGDECLISLKQRMSEEEIHEGEYRFREFALVYVGPTPPR